MATQAVIEPPPRDRPMGAGARIGGVAAGKPLAESSLLGEKAALTMLLRRWQLPVSVQHLRQLLHAQSRIESRIVILHWVVMVLVGAGAVLPRHLGSGLGVVSSTLVLLMLALHPLAYLGAAAFGYRVLSRNQEARSAVFTAIDVMVAIGVLFLTASQPGYTQVLLFTLVLLTATRYSLGRAVSITTLVAVLQFFSIVAVSSNLQITNISSAVLAMFAMTFGVNQLSQAERKEAAIAAENADLYRAVLLRNRELATINALSQSAGQDTDPDRLLESGLELILSSIPVAWGQAFRYARQSDELDLLFVRHACTEGVRASCSDEAAHEALQAVRNRSVVIGEGALLGGETLVRVSAPILVQGSAAGVLQAFVPLARAESGEAPTQSLTIACQELGTLVERALLRDVAQRSLVLEEKSRIARELHDTVLQLLFSSNLSVEWCLHQAADDTALVKKLSEIRRLTAQASNELRGAIFTLSSHIAEVGLMPALEQLTTGFIEQYELPVSFSAMGQPPPDLPVRIQNALHRVVRESLMNAYKHAQASHVAVRLIFEPAQITAVIQDDGIGLPADLAERFAEDSTHFGLRTVARQIEELQGRFEIRGGEEGGTIVRAVMPPRLAEEGVVRERIAAH